MNVHLVLLETAGNQGFIFGTNRMRENVGASQLIYESCGLFVFETLRDIFKHQPRGSFPDIHKLSDLLDEGANPPIQNQKNTGGVEIILAASGKAMMLVREQSLGEKIIQGVTRRVLRDAPGLDIHGIISKAFSLEKESLHKKIGDLHGDMGGVRAKLPSQQLRFMRLPFVEPCETSGLPASHHVLLNKEKYALSEASKSKWDAEARGSGRIKDLIARKGWKPIKNLNAMDELPWLAVIHADGNGLGKLFMAFNHCLGESEPGSDSSAEDWTRWNRRYIQTLGGFSRSLDDCCELAFQKALAGVNDKGGDGKQLKLLPLVLGGDDLTVVCDGKIAVRFAKDFILQFEDATANSKIIVECLENFRAKKSGDPKDPSLDDMPSGRLTICAGIAIVKNHFPFHAAYELSEQLLKSAKRCKPGSALDYHVLYDSTGADLTRLRDALLVDGGKSRLVSKPYTLGKSPGINVPLSRPFEKLEGDVEIIRREDEDEPGRRLLPNSKLHEFREALFLGKKRADALLKLVWDDYRGRGLEKLFPNQSFFEQVAGPETITHQTGLIDAMDLAGEFWESLT